MQYPGEYTQPMLRVTNLQAPVVGGYVTARLQVQGQPGTITQSGYVDNLTIFHVENTGANTVTFRLQGCNDYTSGPREWVGNAMTVVPSGHTAQAVNPHMTYLEVQGQSGTSFLRMQLESRLKWDQLGFDKTDPFYPPFLFNARDPLTTAV